MFCKLRHFVLSAVCKATVQVSPAEGDICVKIHDFGKPFKKVWKSKFTDTWQKYGKSISISSYITEKSVLLFK